MEDEGERHNNPSVREGKLLLKILGEGELSTKLYKKAGAFLRSSKEKPEAAGCFITELPVRKKWVQPSVMKNLARAEEYFAKKRAGASATETESTKTWTLVASNRNIN